MRLDSVEIKATIGRDQVDDAVEKLNLEPDRPPWSIYFCEDVVAAVSTGTPLLDAGVVLRARKRPGGGRLGGAPQGAGGLADRGSLTTRDRRCWRR